MRVSKPQWLKWKQRCRRSLVRLPVIVIVSATITIHRGGGGKTLFKGRRRRGTINAIFDNAVIRILPGTTRIRLEVCKQIPSVVYSSETVGAAEVVRHDGNDCKRVKECGGCSSAWRLFYVFEFLKGIACVLIFSIQNFIVGFTKQEKTKRKKTEWRYKWGRQLSL